MDRPVAPFLRPNHDTWGPLGAPGCRGAVALAQKVTTATHGKMHHQHLSALPGHFRAVLNSYFQKIKDKNSPFSSQYWLCIKIAKALLAQLVTLQVL